MFVIFEVSMMVSTDVTALCDAKLCILVNIYVLFVTA